MNILHYISPFFNKSWQNWKQLKWVWNWIQLLTSIFFRMISSPALGKDSKRIDERGLKYPLEPYLSDLHTFGFRGEVDDAGENQASVSRIDKVRVVHHQHQIMHVIQQRSLHLDKGQTNARFNDNLKYTPGNPMF